MILLAEARKRGGTHDRGRWIAFTHKTTEITRTVYIKIIVNKWMNLYQFIVNYQNIKYNFLIFQTKLNKMKRYENIALERNNREHRCQAQQ